MSPRRRPGAWHATRASWSCATTRTVASWRSAHGRGRFLRRCAGRFIIATEVAVSRAAVGNSARVTTSGTGSTAAPPRCRTSRRSVAGTTGRSTKAAIRWSDSPMESCASGARTADSCRTCRRPLRCRPIPSTRCERGMLRRGFACTRGRRCLGGWENASTWDGRSTSCIRSRPAGHKPNGARRPSSRSPGSLRCAADRSPAERNALGRH